MADEALFPLPRSQIDESDSDNEIPANEVDDAHVVKNSNVETKGEPLTIKTLLSTQKEDTNCCQLAERANAPDSPYFYGEFGILSR